MMLHLFQQIDLLKSQGLEFLHMYCYLMMPLIFMWYIELLNKDQGIRKPSGKRVLSMENQHHAVLPMLFAIPIFLLWLMSLLKVSVLPLAQFLF